MAERPWLVTGATGAIGERITARTESGVLIGLGRRELDITDYAAVAEALSRIRPTLVVNTAAYTSVDAAELNETTAYQVNVTGASNLARACAEFGAGMLHLSTDCVFGEGVRDQPHGEDEAPSPLNVYGRSKYHGELAVARQLPAHLILRTSWVFGPGMPGFVTAVAGSVLRAGRAEVVTNQIGRPTPVDDLISTILACANRLLTGTLAPGIYHFCAAPPVDRLALAEWIAHWLARRTGRPAANLEVRDWHERDQARRACNAVLGTTKLERAAGIRAPDWEPALSRLLEQMVVKATPPIGREG